jgi:hypothetical protein
VSGPLFLILVAAADATSPEVQSLMAALSSGLGPDAQVVMQGYQDPPDDPALAERGRGAGAAAVVRVAWHDETHMRAEVRVYVAATADAYDRLVVFERSDPPAERSRAIGFIVASYLVPLLPRAPPPAAPAPLIVAAAPPPRPASPPRWALEAFAAAGVPVGGAGGGAGGGAALRWRAGDSWGWRASGRVKASKIPVAQATTLSVALSAGIFRVVAGGAAAMRPALALRAEALLLYEVVTHFSDDDPAPVDLGAVLPGGAAMLELEWPMAGAIALHAAAGGEVAAGTTHVLVRNERVAALAALRLVAEAGFRARF